MPDQWPTRRVTPTYPCQTSFLAYKMTPITYQKVYSNGPVYSLVHAATVEGCREVVIILFKKLTVKVKRCGTAVQQVALVKPHVIGLQYNTIQYNTIQYNTIQYNTIPYNTIQYHTISYNTKPYNTIQYNTIQYNTIQYNTIQYNTIQYNTIQLVERLWVF